MSSTTALPVLFAESQQRHAADPQIYPTCLSASSAGLRLWVNGQFRAGPPDRVSRVVWLRAAAGHRGGGCQAGPPGDLGVSFAPR
ncbi:MAG: hypothetical protein U0935_13060 [Pirellulales bacterium]